MFYDCPGLISKWRDTCLWERTWLCISGQSHTDLIFLPRFMFTVLALPDESDPHPGGLIDPWQAGTAGWLVPRALPCLLAHEQQGMMSGKSSGNYSSSPGSTRQHMGKGHIGA